MYALISITSFYTCPIKGITLYKILWILIMKVTEDFKIVGAQLGETWQKMEDRRQIEKLDTAQLGLGFGRSLTKIVMK